MATQAPRIALLTYISPIYLIYFLYIEPLAALSGTYLCIYQPQRFLRGTVPLPAYVSHSTSPSSLTPSIPITPITQLLLTNIASLYVLFAINEGVLLRLTRERKVWLCVVIAMLAADVGHLVAAWEVDPGRALDVGGWNSDEWINYGTLVFGFCLRSAFVIGVGRRG